MLLTLSQQARQWAARAVVTALALSLCAGARAQQVYIGGGDNSPGAFDGYLKDPAGWTYVRDNASGYYVNNFALSSDPKDKTQFDKLQRMAGLFTHKNVFYETDVKRTSDIEDKTKIDILKQFFAVPYATFNEGYSDSRIAALRWRDPKRPVLAMVAPWLIGGDINGDKGASVRKTIVQTDGMTTDGPLGLWRDNTGEMHAGTYSAVKYAHAQKKIAMVMLATHDSGSGDTFLSIGQSCVRGCEDAGAKPDIWVISYYAAQIKQYPVTPEQVGGKAAGTVTGLGYWLLHHLQDPAHSARLTVPPAAGLAVRAASAAPGLSETEVAVPLARGTGGQCAGARAVTLALHNDSAWLDLCPALSATVIGARRNWDVRFRVNGADVTKQIKSADGLAFVGKLRLWPGQTRQVQVTFSCHGAVAGGSAAPVRVRLAMRSNPGAVAPVNQVVTLRAAGLPLPAVLASNR